MRRICTILVSFALVGAGITAFSPQASAAGCSRKGPQVTDKKGDATGFIEEDLGLPNQPSLDVLKGYLSWSRAKKTLTFNVDVADLKASTAAATGKVFRFDFTYGGSDYEARATGNLDGNAFRLYGFDSTTGSATKLIDVTGTFDTKKSEIRIAFLAAPFDAAVKSWAINQGAPRPAPLRERAVFDKLQILGQRYMGGGGTGLTPTADGAVGKCKYSVGQEL